MIDHYTNLVYSSYVGLVIVQSWYKSSTIVSS